MISLDSIDIREKGKLLLRLLTPSFANKVVSLANENSENILHLSKNLKEEHSARPKWTGRVKRIFQIV